MEKPVICRSLPNETCPKLSEVTSFVAPGKLHLGPAEPKPLNE